MAREELARGGDAREVLARVATCCGGPYRYDAGVVYVDADVRWYATSPAPGPGAPLLELRRWPGDTVVAFYALGSASAGPPAEGRWTPLPGGWEGLLPDPGGTRPALWLEKESAGKKDARLGAWILPGDAGLGADGVVAMREEALALWARSATRAEAWAVADVATAPPRLPDLGSAPVTADERRDPWQTIAASGFTVGLPPGVRAKRSDGTVPAPQAVPSGRLWLRGAFVDRGGAQVRLGDASHAGYVAEIAATPTWRSGTSPPLGAPEAKRVDAVDLDSVSLEDAGLRAGRCEHWTEPGFPGDWLVFRLDAGSKGIEIGLPVIGDFHSLALFWIPATWRAEGRAPAPPPIDGAKRLGMAFDRLGSAERKRNPLSEGWFTAPGLRLDLPRGYWPVVSLRTQDGYPVTLNDPAGREAARVRRLSADEAQSALADGRFTALPRPSAQGAASLFARADGGRLLVAREGHAFLIEPGAGVDPAAWERLVDGAQLSAVKGRGKSGPDR